MGPTIAGEAGRPSGDEAEVLRTRYHEIAARATAEAKRRHAERKQREFGDALQRLLGLIGDEKPPPPPPLQLGRVAVIGASLG